MEVKQINGEKVLKSWDYGKSRTAKANLTVTDKRIVSTVEHNKGIDRAEMPLEKVKTVDVFYGKPKRSVGKLIGVAVLFALGILYCVGSFVIIPKMSHLQEMFTDAMYSAIKPIAFTIGAVFLILGLLFLILNPRVLVLSFVARENNCNGLSFGKVNKKIKSANNEKTVMEYAIQIIIVLSIVGLMPLIFINRGGTLIMAYSSSTIFWIIMYTVLKKHKSKRKIEKRCVGITNKNYSKIKLKVSVTVAQEIANELGAMLLNATVA